MQKIVFGICLLLVCTALHAQTDSLQEYTGKYKFPDGSPVTEIGVLLENGVLTATSVMGNSELRKTDNKDVYEIVAYAGTATFKRGDDGQIKTLRIQVQDVDMEGAKTEGGIYLEPGLFSFNLNRSAACPGFSYR
ncbi:MAG: hypothetical protein ACT4OJ_09780 [Bacteroidota bacterium]